MPDAPTWDDIRVAAEAMTDTENEVYGIWSAWQARWGEAALSSRSPGNSFGARLVRREWNAQFDQPEWEEALTFYVDLMNDFVLRATPPTASTRTSRCLQQGRCGMWIDRHRRRLLRDQPRRQLRRRQVGFALAPNAEGIEKRSNWLWAWALAIPAGTQKADAALQFIEWATSKDYIGARGRKRRAGPMCPPARGRRFTRRPNTRKCPSRR